MARYSVYEGFMDDLNKKVAKIERKCAKLGCEFKYEIVGEEYKTVEVEGQKHTLKYIVIEAEGTAIINGWEFVASVEHTEAGNVYGKAMTDVELPERFKCADPYCEHCNTRRIRKNTYIVRNTDTHEFKQIGKACLKSYTNGMSVEAATFAASLKDVFAEASERTPSMGLGYRFYYDTKELLTYCAETIRHFGYVKTGTEGSTKERSNRFYKVGTEQGRMNYKDIEATRAEMERVGFKADRQESRELAEKALAWIADQEDTTDYIHNLKVIASMEYINEGKTGFLASLIPTYSKAMQVEEQKRAEKAASDWVGNVGDRIKIEIADARCITSWESSYGYNTTIVSIYKITDTNGNVYTWKTSSSIDEDAKTLTGTVKAHNEYKGIKQTELTRCRIS